MPKIIILDNDYNNISVNYRAVNYIIRSKYTIDYMARGIPISYEMNTRDIIESAMFMRMTQNLYGISDNDKKLIHIVLAFDDIKHWGHFDNLLMSSSLDYFYSKGFQCAAAFHIKSDKRKYYEHIHLVINKISLDMKKFNDSNQTYYDFANRLFEMTNFNWGIERKVSYYDDDLFDPDFVDEKYLL